MKTIKLLLILIISSFFFTHCNFKEKMGQFGETANKQFGDQHFKTAISLIELHKLRFGTYPETLDSLKFTGQWDIIIKNSVSYQKVDSGYTLDLVNGWIGKPNSLKYPDSFWKGLGLTKSNLKK